MKYGLMVIVLLSGCPATAADLLIGVATYHISERAENHNVENQLAGISGDRYHCATFINSYRQRTLACGAHATAKLGPVELKVLGGAIYGYNSENFRQQIPCSGKYCPYIAAGAAYEFTHELAVEAVVFWDAIALGVRHSW